MQLRYSGYPGGLKAESMNDILEHPERALNGRPPDAPQDTAWPSNDEETQGVRRTGSRPRRARRTEPVPLRQLRSNYAMTDDSQPNPEETPTSDCEAAPAEAAANAAVLESPSDRLHQPKPAWRPRRHCPPTAMAGGVAPDDERLPWLEFASSPVQATSRATSDR